MQLDVGPLEVAPHRAQLATNFGCGTGRRRAIGNALDRGEGLTALVDEGCFLRSKRVGLGAYREKVGLHTGKLVAQALSVGFEVGDHTGVHQLAPVALHRATSLHQHGGDAAGALA